MAMKKYATGEVLGQMPPEDADAQPKEAVTQDDTEDEE